MPTIELPMEPGIVKDNTRLNSESRYVDGSMVRFRRVGKKVQPEVCGGYEDLFDAATGGYLDGKCRALHVYEYEGERQVAAATNTTLYMYTGALLWPITPIRKTNAVSNKVSTTSGSNVVTISSSAHGAITGDTALLRNATTAGGIDLGASGSLNNSITASNNSRNLIINIPNHGFTTGDRITIASIASTIGNIAVSEINKPHTLYKVSSDTIIIAVDSKATSDQSSAGGSGTYTVEKQYKLTVVDANSYTVVAGTNASSSVSNQGGSFTEYLLINIGKEETVAGSGFSSGTYSTGYYSLPSDELANQARLWTLGNFGETLIANYLDSPLYKYENNPSQRAVSISDVALDCPQRNTSFVITPERFIIALGTSDQPSGTYSPLTIAWADQRFGFNNGDWTPEQTNTAGDIILGGASSRIIAGCTMPFLTLVWTQQELFSLQYIPDLKVVFKPTLLGTGVGLMSRNAWARAGDSGSVYWLSSSREFLVWSGGTPTTVNCPMKDYLFDNITNQQEALIYAGTLDSQNEIYWFWPSTVNGVTGNYNYICLNYALLIWTCGTFVDEGITAYIDRGLDQFPIAAFGNGTLRLMERGNTANGAAIPNVFLETGWIDTAEGGEHTFLKRYTPDFIGSGGVNVKIKSKDWPQSTTVTTTDLGPIASDTLKKDCRISARQIALRWDWSDASPTSGRMGRIMVDLEKTDRKR